MYQLLGATSFNEVGSEFLLNKRTSIVDCPARYFNRTSIRGVAPLSNVPAYEREFAHMAAIGWTQPDGKVIWNCGGSLITENFILTAAHCGVWNKKSPDVVRMGDLNLERDDDDKYAQQFSIAEVIYHPEYKTKFRYHDLALLRLNQSVTVHENVCPICLWINSTVQFKSLEATGYGQVGFFGDRTPQLLKVTLSPVNTSYCSEFYPSDRKLNQGITDGQICAIDPELKQDTCPGDSGGPLQIKLLGFNRMTPFLIGVTSFGKSCGTEAPGVYVRISSYIDWIEQETGGTFDPIRCAYKYSQYREYDPAVYFGKPANKRGKIDKIDGTEFRFNVNPRLYEHRATIVPSACSGVFIHEEYVLTSAACLLRAKPELVMSNGEVEHTYKILKVFSHPSFKEGNLEADIALIQLADKVIFAKDDVAPGCLWPETFIFNETLRVTGTGPSAVYSSDFTKELVLKTAYIAAKLNEIPFEDCKKFYDEREGTNITENSLCFGNPDLYILPNSCFNDLGGPLGPKKKYDINDWMWVVGINSYGIDCGFGFPAVATKVSSYIPWIDSVIFADAISHGDACNSPQGPGTCTLQSECSFIVDQGKGSDSYTFCNFNDLSHPLVCCPTAKTILDDCPTLYKKHRQEYNYQTISSHLVVLNETNNCYGALISEQHVLTSIRCANTKTQLPITVKVGDPKCNQTDTDAITIDELTATTSILKLKDSLTFSSCLVPACLWTDGTKVPFKLSPLPKTDSLIPVPVEKCQAASDDDVDEKFGCGWFFGSCKGIISEVYQTGRNESGMAIPYLVGIGSTSALNCPKKGKFTYFERMSSIVEAVSNFLK